MHAECRCKPTQMVRRMSGVISEVEVRDLPAEMKVMHQSLPPQSSLTAEANAFRQRDRARERANITSHESWVSKQARARQLLGGGGATQLPPTQPVPLPYPPPTSRFRGFGDLPPQAAAQAQRNAAIHAQTQAMKLGLRRALVKRGNGDLSGFREDVIAIFSLVRPRAEAEKMFVEAENLLRARVTEGVTKALKKNLPIAIAVNLGVSLFVSLLFKRFK